MIQYILTLPENEFGEQIKTLSVPDLEQVLGLLDKGSNSRKANHAKITLCLKQRKHLLTGIFECTPENMERLQYMTKLVRERAEMLYKKGDQLYTQMLQLWQNGENEQFEDFYVELTLQASYNDEDYSVLRLPDDNSGSNYIRMSEHLTSCHHNVDNNIMTRSRIDYNSDKPRESFSDLRKQCELPAGDDYLWWDQFGCKFPELHQIPISQEFHNLIAHTHYALQDIIRINDIWSKAVVGWQCVDIGMGLAEQYRGNKK